MKDGRTSGRGRRELRGRSPIAGAALALMALVAAPGSLAGCGGGGLGEQPASPQVAVASVPGEPEAHGDHNPHHGGVVLMNGDLHFEVVLDKSGRHRVYFSDAARADLPAAIASDVTLAIRRTAGPPEQLRLDIDETGESWEGEGRPVDDPDATVRVSYTFQNEPYWIDIPFVMPEPAPDAVDPHTGRPKP